MNRIDHDKARIVIGDAMLDGRRFFGVALAEFPKGRRDLLWSGPSYDEAIELAEYLAENTGVRVLDGVRMGK